MTHNTALQLSSAYPVTLDIDDIIHSPSDLIVSLSITSGTISTEVETGVGTIVSVDELVMITMYCASHSRPWSLYAEMTRHIGTLQYTPLSEIYTKGLDQMLVKSVCPRC